MSILGRVSRNPLANIFASLVGTQVVTAGLGVVFWFLAARVLAVPQLGVLAASTAAFVWLGSLAMLGLGTTLISELPSSRPEQRAGLVGSAMATSAAAGLVLGLAWGLVSPLVGSTYAELGRHPVATVLMTIGVGLTAAGAVLDESLLSMKGASIQLSRNATASVVKVVLLPAAALAGAFGAEVAIGSWVVGLLVSILIVRRRVQRLMSGRLFRGLSLHRLRPHARSAVHHHTLNTAMQTGSLTLPVLVAVVLPARDTAFFASARVLTALVLMVPFALSVALFAAGSQDYRAGIARMRRTLPGALAFSVCSYAVLAAAAPLLLQIFGEEYAEEGVTVVRILALAGVPLVFKDHYVALRRMQGHAGQAAIVVAIGTTLELGLALAGGMQFGLLGFCWGWVIGVALHGVALSGVVLRATWSSAHARGGLPTRGDAKVEPVDHVRAGTDADPGRDT